MSIAEIERFTDAELDGVAGGAATRLAWLARGLLQPTDARKLTGFRKLTVLLSSAK